MEGTKQMDGIDGQMEGHRAAVDMGGRHKIQYIDIYMFTSDKLGSDWYVNVKKFLHSQ